MKKIFCLAVISRLLVIPVWAQTTTLPTTTRLATPVPLGAAIRDANTSTFEWIEERTDDQTGQVTPQRHAYVQFASGLNYKDELGQWRESEDRIELTGDGSAAALRGQHKVRFGPNLADGIRITTISNSIFRAQILGLYYFDAATGQSALIAPIQDSTGELLPPNQIVYRGAFKGLKSDVRFTYTKAGFESDVILLEEPLPPEHFGLSSKTARLEIWHEWFGASQPEKRVRTLKQETDIARRNTMVEPDLVDETLDFGDLWFPLGKAFESAASETRATTEPAQIRIAEPGLDGQLLVAKQWIHSSDGIRTFLVEAVDWVDLQPKLAVLPKMADAGPAARTNQVAQGRRFPEARLASNTGQAIRVAALPYAAKGYVLDYIVINPSGSQTFASGVTYYIPNSGYLSGTTIFEAGCKIKFTNNAYLLMFGSIVCNGTTTSPSVLTSVDDDLVLNGETISVSTGKPTYMASQALWVYYVTYNTVIQGMKIRWAKTAVQFDANPGTGLTHTFRDSSIEVSQTGIYANNCSVTIVNATRCGVQTPTTSPTGSYFNGTLTDSCGGDADGDSLPDVWEVTYFGNTTGENGTGDPDTDGLTNSQESSLGGNPMSPDTDDDGLPDNYESVTRTGINNRDSDGDGVWDGGEDFDGDKLSNIAEMKGRPATDPFTANSYVLPKKLLVYYGYPGAINGATTVSEALTHFKKYDYVVLAGRANPTSGPGLEETYADVALQHRQHQVTKTLLASARLEAPNTMFFGYIALGTYKPSGSLLLNYTPADMRQHLDWWKQMKVDGIFWDEFGFDFLRIQGGILDVDVARNRQNLAVDEAHLRGLAVIANAFRANNALLVGPAPSASMIPPKLGASGAPNVSDTYVDFFFYEEHQYDTGDPPPYYEAALDWKNKANNLRTFEKTYDNQNFRTLSLTFNQIDLLYDQGAFHYSWYSAFLFGHEATGWGEYDYSGVSSTASYRKRPTETNPDKFTNPGTFFTDEPTWDNDTNPVIFTRHTNTGTITVNAGTHIGNFP